MHRNIGQIIEGKVTGIQPYGAFVSFDDGYTGLIHISEISNKFVKDIGFFIKEDQKVIAKIIDVDQDTKHLSLSIKALEKNQRRKKYITDMPGDKLGNKSVLDNLNKWIEEKGEWYD